MTLVRRNRTPADAANVMACAVEDVLGLMRVIEAERKERGISMRALSTAAGLGPTSYWGIMQSEENMIAVKATTLAALENALHYHPF